MLKEWWDSFKQKADTSGSFGSMVIAKLGIVILLVGGIAAFLAKFTSAPRFIDDLVISRVVDPTGKLKTEQIRALQYPSVGWAIIILAVVSASMLLVALAYWVKFKVLRSRGAGEASFIAEYESDAAKIHGQLTLLKHAYERLTERTTVTIEEDGTAIMETHRTMKATREPIYIIPWQVYGGFAVESFSEIRLSVQCETSGKEVARLPFINRPLQKGFFIFLLPGLMSGETLELVVSYRWPHGFQPLLDIGRDEYEFEALTPIPTTVVHFRIHENLPVMKIGYQGKAVASEVESGKHLEYRTHRWTITDMQTHDKATFSIERA